MNNKGDAAIVGLIIFALITGFGAYKHHKGDWGKDGNKKVEKEIENN